LSLLRKQRQQQDVLAHFPAPILLDTTLVKADMARSENGRKKKEDALSVRRVQEANSMNRQREDVRLEDEISKQMDDITTKTLKKTKDMDTFERKAQEIRLTKPLSPETLGMGKKFKRRKKSSITKNNSQ
jgi:hypothetical protein